MRKNNFLEILIKKTNYFFVKVWLPNPQICHFRNLNYRGEQAVHKTRFENPHRKKGYIKYMLIGIKSIIPKSKLCDRCI